MALLDRIKDRVQTDLPNTELQFIIDEIAAAINSKFGANEEITVHLNGARRFISLIRPGLSLVVVEIDGTTETTLSADDYRILHGGRTVERLSDGTNSRTRWQRLVKITYTPTSDSKQRDEVTIKIATLDIEFKGLKSERSGDYSANFADYQSQRDGLIDSLAPRRGLLMA